MITHLFFVLTNEISANNGNNAKYVLVASTPIVLPINVHHLCVIIKNTGSYIKKSINNSNLFLCICKID